ncbi:hypothetical protein [Sphingobium yanoikuyae]|uniref:hypothetical protein n=1 Tax=Sphingobium yanoikuyae TaxID=13690 RepID=UPI0012D2A431|nr:hypothetical protein [Sphingobium yanoikuyae]
MAVAVAIGPTVEDHGARITAAEAALGSKASEAEFDAFVTAEAAANASLSNDIAAEITRAQSVEATLSGRVDLLDNNKLDKTTFDTFLDDEAEANQALYDRITDEITRATAAETNANARIDLLDEGKVDKTTYNAFVAAESAANQSLSNDIGAEITRAQGAEAGLQSDIDTEQAERTADVVALDARIDPIEALVPRYNDRAGDARPLFSTALTGDPLNRPIITAGSDEIVAGIGSVLRITGADTDDTSGFIDIVPRLAKPIYDGFVYRLTYRLRRAEDPTDPANNAVELRWQNLNANKASVSNARIGEAITPSVADGLVTYVFQIGKAGVHDNIDYTIPPSAVYGLPFIRVYGNGQQTDIVSIDVENITDTVVLLDENADVVADVADLRTDLTQTNADLAAEVARATGIEDQLRIDTDANRVDLTAEIARAEGVEQGLRVDVDVAQEGVDSLDGSVARLIPPTLANQPDWAELTIDSDDRPVGGFTKEGRYLAANVGRMSHLFGGMEDRFVPLIDLWAELTLDENGQFVRGTRVDGTSWVAKSGHLARTYGVADVPELVRTSEQSIGGVEIPEYIEMTVDSENRPVSAIDPYGRYYRADRGRMSHLFGGPEVGRSAPAVELWSDLTLDSDDRFVSGTRVDGSRWLAKRGVVTRDLRAGDLFSVSPLVQLWSALTLDKDGRFVSGTRLDGTRWIAQGGLVVRDGGSSGSSGAETLTAIAAYGDSTTNGDDLDSDGTLTPDWRAFRWTNLLAAELGLTVVNRGMNGHKTDQIAARAGGIRMTADVTGGSIPASGSVPLTNLSITDPLVLASGQDPYTFTVDLIADDGSAVHGTLSRTNSTTYSFARAVAGAAKTVTTADIVAVTGRTDMTVFAIFGAFTNDEPGNAGPALTAAQIAKLNGDYRSMATAAKAGFLCWGPLDRGYQERAGTFNGDFIREREAWLRAEFGANFMDIRGYLASPRALADAAIVQPGFVPATNADPQLDDAASVAANTIPPSFRYSGVHLNPLGHKLMARFIERVIRARFNLFVAS